MKHELLVPVGNYASLIAAINNGADAVYLSGKKFGARAFADNFTDDELKDVISLCHLYGVKVYITVNTLIYDNEINEVFNYVKKIHSYGVDAVIMQDVGLINLVHKSLPNLEIHASTQMHNHSAESMEFLKELGIKRVVYAREMSIDEINNIDTDLEKEVFIHGALCISYSGQCLFSSCILNRSGNRGACAGMCRLPYKLLENNKYVKTEGDYLLSPKDLCSVENFEKLMQSNIKSFKIEGRMKSSAYVGMVTRIYKDLMNKYDNGEEVKVNKDDFELLKAIFNREYTKGFLFNDNELMNFKAPNHMGIHLGNVIEVTPKKLKIKLDRDLQQFEAVRFKNANKGFVINFLYAENDKLINQAKKGDIIYLDNFLNLQVCDEVLLTNPLVAEEKTITKKIPVDVVCEAKLEEKIKLSVFDGINNINVTGPIVEKSKTSPITQDRLENALRKTGNTPFEIVKLDIKMDEDIFIPISSLNELRREALDKLKIEREKVNVPYVEKEFNRNISYSSENKINLNVLVRTKEQIKACKDYGIKNIIVENPLLMEDDLIFKIPRDNNKHKYNYQKFLVTDYASLNKYPASIGDYPLNITNHYTFDYLSNKAKSLMLSVELNFAQIKELLSYYEKKINAEVLIYGRVELMLMKYCLLKEVINQDKICHVCQNGKKYFLEDRNGAKYPLINNPLTHGMIILNHEVINRTNDVKELLDLGVTNFRIELFDESYEKTREILKSVNLL